MAIRGVAIALIMGTASLTVLGSTISVPAGGNLQAAIDTAQPGDTIIVEAGATFRGPIELPAKSGDAEIVIQSSRANELPQGRVNPLYSALMPKIVAPNAEPAIKTRAGAHHYRLLGLEIAPESALITVYDLVRLGEGRDAQTSLDQVPHHLTLDRLYVHGLNTQDAQRGIALNSGQTSIINSYISDIHGVGFDTQAIGGWNGPGPYSIINNHLEAAGENVMFGGAKSGIANLVPSNIEIRHNYFFKPLSWKVGDLSYAGKHWTVKNLLELKNAQNVIIDDNDFENCWPDAQYGDAIVFTVRSEQGSEPWNAVKNISFTNNRVRNAYRGIQTLGADWNGGVLYPSQGGSDLLVFNNLFEIGEWFFTLNEFANVTLEHNTHLQGSSAFVFTGQPSKGFVYRYNATLLDPRGYGFFGDGVGEGTVALNQYCPSFVFTSNVIAGGVANLYPEGNFFPNDLFALTSFTGTDGLVPGYLGVTSLPSPSPAPTPSPTPTPTPTPIPSPTPVPSPTPTPSPSDPPIGTLKQGVTWDTTEARQDAEAKRQRAEGWYFYKNQSGKKATFIYTGVKLP